MKIPIGTRCLINKNTLNKQFINEIVITKEILNGKHNDDNNIIYRISFTSNIKYGFIEDLYYLYELDIIYDDVINF